MFSPAFLDLRDFKLRDLPGEIVAAGAVAFLTIPQAVAYAVVAGLPPATGLYAAALPAIVGSLFRSSRHVVAGPSNALSLLVGASLANLAGMDPVQAAATLALMVGGFQLLAGLLQLGAVVDYISSPVVLGYITGAGVLIAAGQLHNLTGTPAAHGYLLTTVGSWLGDLGDLNPLPIAVAAGTLLLVLILQRLKPKLPGALIAMSLGIAVNVALGLEDHGLIAVETLAPIPQGLPPLSLPSLEGLGLLLPAAVATTVLSLVESTSVARAIASRSGQRIDASTEFLGQGLANLVSAVSGGYPISGSLARSALNESAGARSRIAGMLGGGFILVVLLVLAPVVDRTPIASLAGLLMLLAWNLINIPRIREVLRSRRSDSLAFFATMIGTWVLSMDEAIYLGVGISLVLFLRQARLLVIRELAVDSMDRLREVDGDEAEEGFERCRQIRVLHVEGALFFGAAGELRETLEDAGMAPGIVALIVRIKRTHGLDITTAQALASVAESMANQGRRLMLVGMRPDAMETLRRSGAAARIGEENLFPTQPTWFAAMKRAVDQALGLLDEASRAACPLARL